MPTILAIIGTIFWFIADFLIVVAIRMEISVPSEGANQIENAPDRIANLSLMHTQAVTIALGVGAAIVGTMLLCTAALISSRRKDMANG